VVSGGSTITQQLARNLWLSPKRTIRRKLLEWVLAVSLEAVVEKRRILELYLNTVEWERDIWGCREASDHYFRKKSVGTRLR
jgi:monofunctional biosynthetic peptidoglycan transglycosylase